ncbi:phage baseplate assembly protein [Desulfonatronovibrio hydrogenovorans]|uniref:phage baseplate assembly protein n=1 Tax=Desulfonatronovibrio hydrogenovorans TaxID=53245 RepID=UPI00048EDD93|nr:contractile injection system protein, VgrG/Pvc8 family [Desulfonatronovibrio hydrogenovorans]
MFKDQVILQIGTQRHQGWQEIEIRRSLEQIADRFELALTERWSDDGTTQARPIRPGEKCKVYLGDDLLLTGHLDDVLPDYDAERHRIVASGRSLAGDLVDCSGQEKRWENRTLVQIVRAICEEYGLDVIDEAGADKKISHFSIEDGESPAEAIGRAAKNRGVRVVSDPRGSLIITDAQRRSVGTALELGVNVLSGRGEFSDRDRFAEYIVEGQSPGTDWFFGEAVAAPRGRAKDPRIRGSRRVLVVADTVVDRADCRQRAELESRVRWARGRGITYTVVGWRHEHGVWRPGDMVPVKDAYMGLDKEMLISDVQLLDDEQGRRAELRVNPPEAFERVPVPEPEPEETGWW